MDSGLQLEGFMASLNLGDRITIEGVPGILMCTTICNGVATFEFEYSAYKRAVRTYYRLERWGA